MEFIELLKATIDKGASDLHITVGVPPMLRIDGELRCVEGAAVLRPDDTRSVIYSILSGEQKAKFEEHFELDFSLGVQNLSRFRINVHMQRGTVAASIRTIPKNIPKIDDLGLPAIAKELAKRPRGLVLVTGPTGSGKSTTLASMIDLINSERSCHIITIEDPIEYLHQHKTSVIEQREVGADTSSFTSALKYVLRQDPDVILIGEMRDLETIAAAITAAETGHLVFATLHTTDAAQTVDRIIDVFPSYQQQQIRMQLASTLEGVLAQQLLPKASGKGRVCAMEVLIGTPAVQNLIREEKTQQLYATMEASNRVGMQTLDRALATLYKRGLINYEMALQKVHKKEEMIRVLTM